MYVCVLDKESRLDGWYFLQEKGVVRGDVCAVRMGIN